MSWKPEIQTINDDKWYANGLCFATKEEAEYSARDIHARWLLARAWRAVESNDPVNYKIDLEKGTMEAVDDSRAA